MSNKRLRHPKPPYNAFGGFVRGGKIVARYAYCGWIYTLHATKGWRREQGSGALTLRPAVRPQPRGGPIKSQLPLQDVRALVGR